MRILHWLLGFDRAGGLNRYAADLARAQAKRGDIVFAFCPEGSLLPKRRAAIRRRRDRDGVVRFALTGGRPVPLLEGVRDPEALLHPRNVLSEETIRAFLDETSPDVVHVHTWMGFPEELLPELRRRRIALVFTTHDYFALCPRVNFIDGAGRLCAAPSDETCSRCNRNAPSSRFLALRNAPLLLRCKSWLRPLLALRARNRRSAAPTQEDRPRESKHAEPAVTTKRYLALVERQKELLLACGRIHFNSEATRAVYARFLPELQGSTIPIAHAGISDRRRARTANPKCVRLCFIGAETPYKGLPMLEEILRDLWNRGVRNWSLDVWGTPVRDAQDATNPANAPAIRRRGSFRPEDEESVFQNADLLVVPSICNETFGFVVAEALSFGLPVLCSDMVGAKILLDSKWIFHGERGLRAALKKLFDDPSMLNEANARILAAPPVPTMERHEQDIEAFYRLALAAAKRSEGKD